jgi:hypothetical protein
VRESNLACGATITDSRINRRGFLAAAAAGVSVAGYATEALANPPPAGKSGAIAKIRSLKLRDVRFGDQWDKEVHNHWVYDDFQAHRDWKEGWLSFDCATYRPDDRRVYLGVTSFDENRIFCAYDRKADQFVDLGYSRVASPFDAKFHRSLIRSKDDRIYAAPALLHCPDKYFAAAGAAIIEYRPDNGQIRKLGIPFPHIYVQSLTLDEQRQVLYLLCFSPEYLGSYNLRTGEGRLLAQLGAGCGEMAQGENVILDDEHCVWSSWSLTRAWSDTPGPDAFRLCKYDPKRDCMKFFATGLPYPDGRPGFSHVESYFNFGDGAIYASGENGALYRVDPTNGKAEFLFTPVTGRPSRLSSLVASKDGAAYGITGREGRCELMRVDYRRGTFEKLGKIVDADGEPMWQCHDILLTEDGVLYACENDNPRRTSYLWEITMGG